MGRRTPPPADLPDWLREGGEALDRAAADVAAAYGTTLEDAAETIHQALIDPAPPFAAYGIAVDFRWWERPRRLWARHATKRTATGLGF